MKVYTKDITDAAYQVCAIEDEIQKEVDIKVTVDVDKEENL